MKAKVSSLFVILLLGVFASNAHGQVGFARTDYPTGMRPTSVIAGDFNGDTKLDLAVACENSNSVSVLLGNGDGTFGPKTDFVTGSCPVSVTAGDFNGDGNLDLATANTCIGSNSVSILLGNGAGGFGPKTDFAAGTGPVSVTTGDFNSDGKLDLATANQVSNTISILLGNGGGTFGPKTDFATGLNPLSVIAGDFNGDGKLDLATANQASNTVSILLGNGDGTFSARTDFATGIDPVSLTKADFSLDVKLDLATADSFYNSISVLLGNGDGTFNPKTDLGTGTGPVSITAADFNNDGKPDLATSNFGYYSCCYYGYGGTYIQGSVSVLLGLGNGTFAGRMDFGVALGLRSIATGDFNADGKPDVAVTNQSSDLVSVLVQAPAMSLSTGSLAFGDRLVGTSSPPKTVTLTSTGSFPLNVGSVTLTGTHSADFNKTADTCSAATLPAGNSCNITVTFTPTSVGSKMASITIPNNAPGNPHSVALDGAGVLNAPLVSLSPSSLSFASQIVGTTSAAQAVTLTNMGGSTLNISSIAISGANSSEFSLSAGSTCPLTGGTLAASANCTMNVTFTPTATGTRTATIVITDNAAGSPHTVNLSGEGITPPAVSLSPTSLTFPSQLVGTTSAAQTVTLINTGGSTLNISGISISGDFAKTDNCGSSVAAGANCTISVTFMPTAAGSRAGTITITHNAPGSPHTVNLTGEGITPAAVLLSPASLTFPSQVVGTTSPAQTVTLTNTGGSTLNIFGMAISLDFTKADNCGTSVVAGANCIISVTFHPTVAGALTGTLTITDDAAGSPHTVNLSGTGATGPAPGDNPVPVLTSFSPTSGPAGGGGFTLTVTGSNFVSSSLVRWNGSDRPTTLMSSTQLQAFVGASDVAAPGSAQITVFNPPPGGGTSNALTFTITAPAGVTLSPASLAFGSQLVGTTSAAQTVTLTNTGGSALNISSITVSGDFAQTAGNCGPSVAAGGSCTISVAFTPAAVGTRTGTVIITDNAPGSPHTVSLTGTGVAPAVSLSPASLTFASQLVGTTSAGQSVALSNTGSTSLTISSITPSGDFAQSHNCPGSLPASANCTITVTFTPSATGNRIGEITITHNATGSPHRVSLSGTGVAPAVSLAPASLAFGSQLVGTTSAPQTVTLSNTGSATLAISSITPSGDFAQTNTCGADLAPGASCVISVSFGPTATGARTGAVTITDNAAGSPHTVALSGTGVAPAVTLSPASLTFGSQLVSTTSAAQVVTLSNAGGSALNISSMTISGDFAKADNCGASVAAGANCTISVTFTPSAVGNRAGTITITDDAPGSPHTIALSGAGVDFSISMPPGSSPTVTVSAGQTANYAISLASSNGFMGAVSLGCSGAPAAATCSVSPASVQLTGAGVASVAVTVTTTSRSMVTPWRPSSPRAPGLLWLLVSVLLICFAAARHWRATLRGCWLRELAPATATVLLALLLAGCAGGGASEPPPQLRPPAAQTGTPAGTYSLTVTGSSAGVSRSITLTLVVN